MKKVLFALSMLLFSGCGHNLVTQSKGWGIDMTWNPDALMPSIRLGYWDVSYAMVKENASVEMQSNAGLNADTGNSNKEAEPTRGILSSAASGTVNNNIKLTTHGQTNGYVVDVLTSENAEDNAKIAKYLYGVPAEETSK